MQVVCDPDTSPRSRPLFPRPPASTTPPPGPAPPAPPPPPPPRARPPPPPVEFCLLPGDVSKTGHNLHPERGRTHPMSITVYTKPGCVQCDMTKRLLDRRSVAYT